MHSGPRPNYNPYGSPPFPQASNYGPYSGPPGPLPPNQYQNFPPPSNYSPYSGPPPPNQYQNFPPPSNYSPYSGPPGPPPPNYNHYGGPPVPPPPPINYDSSYSHSYPSNPDQYSETGQSSSAPPPKGGSFINKLEKLVNMDLNRDGTIAGKPTKSPDKKH